ncbi:hypothetical protein [Crocosphaera sp.]|uniref:hypothetical protein n=1 Tax=Crocosphaera sp. TaxID=2729996 RepID=UPI0026031FD9|nr:hypothetical protein [Crocosphaera sp.]MDJ0579063.1 hypothetical protein [Crocosphaera sp.]
MNQLTSNEINYDPLIPFIAQGKSFAQQFNDKALLWHLSETDNLFRGGASISIFEKDIETENGLDKMITRFCHPSEFDVSIMLAIAFCFVGSSDDSNNQKEG